MNEENNIKIISIDYLKKNMEEIEKVADKDFQSAVLSLIKFQSGNYLIDDINIQKIDSVSLNTVFAFNKALITDISNSYDTLKASILTVYDSDFKDLLEDKMFIEHREIKVEVLEDETLDLIDVETKDYVVENFKDTVNYESGQYLFNYRYQSTKVEKEKNVQFELENGYGFQELQIKYKLFESKNDIPVAIRRKEGAKIEKVILIKNSFKILKKGIYYVVDEENPTCIDVSPRLLFVDEAFKNLTGVDKYSYMLLSNRSEEFTYGYLNDSTKYLISDTKKRTRHRINGEYDDNIQKGRAEYDDLLIDIDILKEISQYTIDMNESVDDFTSKIRQFKENSKSILPSMMKDLIDTQDTKTMIEDLFVFINKSINEVLDTMDIEKISFSKDIFFNDKNKEKHLESLCSFLKSKKTIDVSMQIFKNIKQKEFNIIEKDLNIDEINDFLKNYIIRKRASIYDVKMDSFVLNLREGSPLLNEAFEKEYNKNDDLKIIVENLKINKYYDFFEFDRDFILDKSEGRKELLKFSEAILELDLPVEIKNSFKVRKLGNLGGKSFNVGGLYSDFAGMIVVDTRYGNGFGSVKHEETHRMDLQNTDKVGRYGIISKLRNYFISIEKELSKPDYFLKDEELIARGGEIACLLINGNFQKYKEDYRSGKIKSETELWENVKKDFESSKDAVLMKEYDTYASEPQYVKFENMLNEKSREYEILNDCLEYYKPFYTKEQTDVRKILAQSRKVGNKNREIEGLQPKSFGTTWSLNRGKTKEVDSIVLNYKIKNNDKLEKINFNKKSNQSIKSLEEVIKDFNKDKGNSEELLFHVSGGGFTKDILLKLELNTISNIYSSNEVLTKLVDKNIVNANDALTFYMKAIEESKFKESISFYKGFSYLEKSKILQDYSISNREINEHEYEVIKDLGGLISRIDSESVAKFFSIISSDNFKKNPFDFLADAKLSIKSNTLVAEKIRDLMYLFHSEKNLTKSDLEKIGISDYNDYKMLFIGDISDIKDFFYMNESILDSTNIEYKKENLCLDIFNTRDLFFDSQKNYATNKIILSEEEANKYISLSLEKRMREYSRTRDLLENFELENKSKSELVEILLETTAKKEINIKMRNQEDSSSLLKDKLINVLKYAVEKMEFKDYMEISEVLKGIHKKYLINENINIKGIPYYENRIKPREKVVSSNVVENAIAYSDELGSDLHSMASAYFAIENKDYDKASYLMNSFNHEKISGMTIALDNNFKDDVFFKLSNSKEPIYQRIINSVSDFKEITQDKHDLTSKVKLYIENKLNNKLGRYEKELLGDIVSSIVFFSKELSYSKLQEQLGGKATINKFLADFVEPFSYTQFDLLDISTINLNVVKENVIEKNDYDKILARINKMLNSLSSIDIDFRKKLGEKTKREVDRIFCPNNSRSVKSLIFDSAKIKDFGLKEDKLEYYEMVNNQNKLFLLNEALNAIARNNTDFPSLDKLEQLLEKNYFHYIREESDKQRVGTEIIEKILNSPSISSMEIPLNIGNKMGIETMDEIKVRIGQIDTAEDKIKEDVNIDEEKEIEEVIGVSI